VIVPLDGSTNAEAILPHALFFALQTQSALTLLRVIMPPGEPEYAVPYIPDDWYEGEVMWTKNYLASLATRLQAQGTRVQTQHVEGTSAGAAINSYAEQHADAQLIALATHGRDAGGRLLLGSVAGDVFASAPTSVLLLHPPKDEQIPPGPISQASYQTIVVPLE
jgi:nucleotide-binding universal stress UspA family protein